MAKFSYIPNRVIDTNGISDGANIYFYTPGTTTPVTIYSDAGFATPVSNPYPVSSGAAVPALYHNESGGVRVKVVDSSGNTVSDDNPWSAFAADVVSTATGDDLQGAIDGYATRTAIKALTSYSGARAYLTESGREGEWVFRSGDYSTEITADTQEGIYLKADDTAATSGAWVRQYSGAIDPRWFGVAGDGVTDDYANLQAALDMADTLSGFQTVSGCGLTFSTSATLSVAFDVMFDGRGATIVPSTDNHGIDVVKGAHVWNTTVDVSGGTFSDGKAAFRFNHTAATQGHQNNLPVWNNCKAKLPSAATGTGFLVNAVSFYVQYLRMENLIVDRGNIALHFQGGASTYCSGNSVDGLIVFDSKIALKCDYARGNTVTGVAAEKNTYDAAIKLSNDSDGNRITGIRWDNATIEIDATSDENVIDVMQSGPAASVTDDGRNNVVTFSGGKQVANTSLDYGNDLRGYLDNPGLIEFKDQLAGGVSPYWTQTIDAGASITYAQAFEGAAADNTQWTRRAKLNSASSGTCRLDFNDIPFVVPENNLRLHLIFAANNTGTNRTRIGLIDAAGTSGIYFEKDNATYADEIWRLVVVKSGTATTTVLGTANASTNIFYATLEIGPTDIFYGLGKYVNSAGNDTGRVGRGIDAIWNTARSTHVGQGNITTNIPDGVGLQPFVECEDATNAGRMDLIFYHLIGGYRADNT